MKLKVIVGASLLFVLVGCSGAAAPDGATARPDLQHPFGADAGAADASADAKHADAAPSDASAASDSPADAKSNDADCECGYAYSEDCIEALVKCDLDPAKCADVAASCHCRQHCL